ncbi:hypothetical protein Tco_1415113 [Tanacetum coccineum]
MKCVTKDHVKPKVLAPGSVETLRKIVEEAKELLEYVIGTCPKDFNQQDKKHAATPLTRKKQVTFEDQCETSNSNAHKHVEQLKIQKTNVLVPPSTGVNSCTDASGSQPRSNTKKNRILLAKSVNKKKVEEHPRTNQSSLKTTNYVDSSVNSKHTVINLNYHSICQTCNKCLISANHDVCVVNYLHSMSASCSVNNVVCKVKQVWKPKHAKKMWKAIRKMLTIVGYQWRPTGRIFTLGEQCPLTRLTKPDVVPAKQTENVSTSKSMITKKLSHTSQKPLTIYQSKNQQFQAVPVSLPTSPENQATDASMRSAIAYANQQEPDQNWGSNFPNSPSSSVFKCKLYKSSFWYLDSCYSKHMTGDRSRLRNFIKKFIGTIRFGNDHFGAIMDYGDYVIGDSVISKLSKPMAPVQLSTGPAPMFLTPRQISSGLVPNPVPTAPYVPPTNKELEILFQLMFDEYLEPTRVERSVSLALAVLVPVNSANTPSSTTID